MNQQVPDIEFTFQNIRNWAEARNLIEGATPQAQFVKLVEEFKEFVDGHLNLDFPEVLDGLGDTMVVLTILAAQLGTSIEECIVSIDDDLEQANSTDGILSKVTGVNELSLRAISSIGELATGISKKDMTKVKTGIGGAYRVLEAICYRFDLSGEYAASNAYEVIKDRKGRMVDGVFIKEADLANYGIAS